MNMDVSAVKTPLDVSVAVYGAQVSVAQSAPVVVPPKEDNKASAVVQLVTSATTDKANIQTDELAKLHRVTAAMNQFVDALDTDTHIQFKLHQKTNELMVQIVDQKTDKVIREYPTKEFLDTIAAIRTYVGLMLDKKI